jgi:ABC-type glycerol-3-phosphate transport system substrate-binding protein
MSQQAFPARALALAGVAGLAMATLAGCTPSGTASQAASGDAESGDITWWGWTPDQTVADKLIAAFNEEYPDISVEFVSKPIDTYDSVLGPAITSSDGPDVFNVGPGSTNGGVDTFGAGAIDLRPAVEEALGADWDTKLAAPGIEPLQVDGKVVGLSAGAVYSGSIWINQDIFDEHGLTPPTTLDEWVSVCEKLEAAGQGCFVQGAGQAAFDMDTFEAIMENIEPGAYVAASRGEKNYTDPEFVQGMEIWKELFSNGIMQEGAIGVQQYPDASNAFFAGKYAMVMMGTWYTQYTVEDVMIAAMEAAGVSNPEPFTLVPIRFPDVVGNGETGNMFGDADYGLAVSGKSDQQAAATTFAVWLATSEAGQQAVANTLNDIPSLIGVQPVWDEIELVNPEKQLAALQEYTELAGAATQPRFASIGADLNTAIQDALIGVASGDVEIEQALQTMQAEVDAQ